MNLYVAEQEFDERGETTIKTVSEISQDELNALNEAFSFCGVSHTITEIRDIVIENGAAFKKWMTPKNLKSQYDNKMSPEELVRTANKLILNYATSTKTYIDIETRILAQNETKSKRTLESLTHELYDKYMEYRFWAMFRNYVVHCAFPYTIFHADEKNGIQLICTKEHLLEYKKWKHVEADIKQMDAIMDLPQLVDGMNNIIEALYMDFYARFGKRIIDGVSCYAAFCRKYKVKNPIVLKSNGTKNINELKAQPLMASELFRAFDILKNNPTVHINIV